MGLGSEAIQQFLGPRTIAVGCQLENGSRLVDTTDTRCAIEMPAPSKSERLTVRTVLALPEAMSTCCWIAA